MQRRLYKVSIRPYGTPLYWPREFVAFSTDDIITVKEGSKVPRRGNIAKRDVLPDPLYNSKLVTRLVNNVMYDGKKGLPRRSFTERLTSSVKRQEKNPLEVFEQAMENVMPSLEVKARRVGGATYQVPMEVRPERRQTLGLRWMTAYSRLSSEKTMKERLAGEILDAVNGAGGAAKSVTTRTRWLRPTRLLHTIAGNSPTGVRLLQM